MIRYTTGNLLEADVDALVNTVNEVGVMGKGIALMFREAFPHNTEVYVRAAREKRIRIGEMFVTENLGFDGPRWIINFPTKKHWRHPSKLDWIRSGLIDLVRVIQERSIRSIAIPPLGSGAGGLDWPAVRAEVEKALSTLEGVEVLVYEPTTKYQTEAKKRGVEQLTPARALVLEAIRRYEILGLDCSILEVQKLAWFLARALSRLQLPDVLRLQFKANRYGPYDDRLRHLLDGLDGSYLHASKRLADSKPLDLIHFDYARQSTLLAYFQTNEAKPYARAADMVARWIDGFESPLGMEVLATVDWLLTRDAVLPDVHAVRAALKNWPGGPGAAKRKLFLLDARLIKIALDRLATPPDSHERDLFSRAAG